MTRNRAIRHLGREILYATEKDDGRWMLSNKEEVLDLSGGPLLQTLTKISPPPAELFSNVSPSGGVETPIREKAETELLYHAGSACGGVLYTTSGSDAIEASLWAISQSNAINGKPKISTYVVRQGSYHGNSNLSRWLSTRGQKKMMRSPLDASLVILEEPHSCQPNNSQIWLDSICSQMKEKNLREGTVLVLETVTTTGLHYWAGIDAYRRLLDWCQDRGILVVFDEIASGAYRHGWFSAFDWNSSTSAAAILLSKSLTCGTFPISCVLLKKEIADCLKTHGKRPLSFTYGLSDPAAWLMLDCLHRYKRLHSTGFYDRRKSLIIQTAQRLSQIPSCLRVEFTNTSLRVSTTAFFASKVREGLNRDNLIVYESSSEFSFGSLSFFHICPPFDIDEAIVKDWMAKFCLAVERIKV